MEHLAPSLTLAHITASWQSDLPVGAYYIAWVGGWVEWGWVVRIVMLVKWVVFQWNYWTKRVKLVSCCMCPHGVIVCVSVRSTDFITAAQVSNLSHTLKWGNVNVLPPYLDLLWPFCVQTVDHLKTASKILPSHCFTLAQVRIGLKHSRRLLWWLPVWRETLVSHYGRKELCYLRVGRKSTNRTHPLASHWCLPVFVFHLFVSLLNPLAVFCFSLFTSPSISNPLPHHSFSLFLSLLGLSPPFLVIYTSACEGDHYSERLQASLIRPRLFINSVQRPVPYHALSSLGDWLPT